MQEDDKSATLQAAEQIVGELGAGAGFMIAVRIIQVIAQRSTHSPELAEAFEAALRNMEKFATTAGLSPSETPPNQAN